jgi:hypothetical protein
MTPTKKDARLAGLLYLPVVFPDPFVLFYVPGRTFAPGDASATVANLLAHESHFRSNIVIGMVSQLFFVASVLALASRPWSQRFRWKSPHGTCAGASRTSPHRLAHRDRWRNDHESGRVAPAQAASPAAGVPVRLAAPITSSPRRWKR